MTATPGPVTTGTLPAPCCPKPGGPQRGGPSSPLDDIQVLHLLRIGYAAAEKAIPEPTVEHAELMSGGGMHVRKESDWTRKRWPVTEWVADVLRQGGKVYRRTGIVINDWEEVTR